MDGEHPGIVANNDDGFYLHLSSKHEADGIGDHVVSDAESVWWYIGDSFHTQPEGTDISGTVGRQFITEWQGLGASRLSREAQSEFFREWRDRVWPELAT